MRVKMSKLLRVSNFFEFLIIISLLFISGIERNPGPVSSASFSSLSSSTTLEEKLIKDKFSVVHYNVQSIVNKLDIIEMEFKILTLYA